MKYLSEEEAILWAISELKATTHPFLGITFLACKEGGLPVGKTAPVRLDSLTNKHLRRHHRFDPASEFLFQPFRSAKNWVKRNYASTGLQAVNTQSFGSVFLHERGKPEWVFADDYVGRTKARIQTLGYRRVPVAAIAIWTSKDGQWQGRTTLGDLIDEFRWQYNISGKGREENCSRGRVWSPWISNCSSRASQTGRRSPTDSSRPRTRRSPEGTLTAIRMKRVGPADELRLELGERLTVIAGDNGLGKSFLLDVAWRAATEGWAGRPATPFGRKDAYEAVIEYELRTDTGVKKCRSRFDARTQSWVRQNEYPQVPGLYVYARVDGAFSVADDRRDRVGVATIDFTARQVWEGKHGETEGLIRDWVRWQISGEEGVSLLQEVLKCLSPGDLGLMELSNPRVHRAAVGPAAGLRGASRADVRPAVPGPPGRSDPRRHVHDGDASRARARIRRSACRTRTIHSRTTRTIRSGSPSCRRSTRTTRS